MLTEIRIEGLGVINAASAEFAPGLTVLTGETGAGKTMVVTSLHLLGGARADASRVRTGADRAVVEGRFTTDHVPADTVELVDEVLDATGAERDDDGSVIAVRSVGKDGRSRAFLGGRSAPVATLSSVTNALLTVHGQNDQLRLLKSGQQRIALDRFAGDSVAKPLATYTVARKAWLVARKDLAQRTERSRELAQEADRLTFGINEIDAVNPTPGEDADLTATIRRLTDVDSLRESASLAHEQFSGDAESAAIATLGRVRSILETAEDDALRQLAPRVDDALAVVADVAGELSSYLDALPADPGALDSLLTRQSELKALTRKYAADVDGVLAWRADAASRLASLDVSTEAISALAAAVAAAEADVAAAAKKLRAARVKAAKALSTAVSAELSGLAMGKASLTVELRPVLAADGDSALIDIAGLRCHAGSGGVDEVEFRLTAHPGAQALPIGKSASGGELSRVMLALEVVLAASGHGTTMVFDEVDAGVGGRAAVEIGKRLARLAKSHQVIVVTHLPQVAAFADSHLVVDKSDSSAKGPVTSGVRALGDEERVGELARMLAGLDDTDTGRAHAEELLAAARSEK